MGRWDSRWRIHLKFIFSNVKHILSELEEQLTSAQKCLCMLHEITVIICHQSLSGRLMFLKLSSHLHARSLEPIQSDQLVLIRVSYQQPFPQFARLVGLQEESWLSSNFFPFRMMDYAALSPTFSPAEFFFNVSQICTLCTALSLASRGSSCRLESLVEFKSWRAKISKMVETK